MTKYKCGNPNCGAEFEEAGTYKEYHNEIEGDFYELLPCCPVCGCEDYNEIEEEPDEIEDNETEIESFSYLVVVRYNSLLGYYRNAYFYASDKEEAGAIVDKYMNKSSSLKDRTRLCRIYKLVDEQAGSCIKGGRQ